MSQAKTIILDALEAYAGILEADTLLIRDPVLIEVLQNTAERVRICRAFLVTEGWNQE